MSEKTRGEPIALNRHLRRKVTPIIQQFGGLRTIHRCADTYWIQLLGPMCMLIGILLLGIYATNYELLFSWWQLTQVHLFLTVCGLWLVLGCILTLACSFTPRGCMLVCTGGLISVRRTITTLAWSDIEWIKQVPSQRKQRPEMLSYMIRTRTGERFLLPSDIRDITWLVNVIERKISTYQDRMKL